MASSKFMLRTDALFGVLIRGLKAETVYKVNAKLQMNLNIEVEHMYSRT